jgi:hypothetical protein
MRLEPAEALEIQDGLHRLGAQLYEIGGEFAECAPGLGAATSAISLDAWRAAHM